MMYVFIAASMALASALSPTTTTDGNGNGYSESDEPTICYGDDECRGKQVCDMGSYICVDPTPSPVTPAPTNAPGCCYDPDSYKGNGRCSAAADQDRCEDMGCTFLVTDDDTDCEMTTTETPTTTAEVGCCKGDSRQTNSMCNSRLTREQCERSSSCHFIKDGSVDDECQFPPTEEPEEPGCCYVNPAGAYTKRWQDTCTGYFTERECLFNVDDSGMTRCVFEPMNEYMDCEALWPTTTETPTEPAGCCYGDDYKQNDRCEKATDRARCEDMGCHFLVTDDPEDCVMTTTTSPTTTEEVGCCKGDSHKTNAMCNARPNRAQCERSSSCEFILNGVLDVDCVMPFTEPPVEPGCCYGNPDIAYSKRWMDQCKTFGTEAECLMLKNDDGEPRCYFEPLGEYEDCETVWPTTTTTTEEVGCCRGDSYKANGKCARATSRSKCEDMGCEFLVTDDPSDCEMTTTETPTTTATPGCCRGDSLKSQDKCNAIEDKDKCNARSSCQFIDFGILEFDCKWEVHTDPPSEPGCCYGNPDIAYSKRWMESCKTFGTEEECLMLTNDDGEPRCYFEPLGEYEDCETVWPTTTTTTEEVGCCHGDSYKANDKCARATDRARCEDMGCTFLKTDDPTDCEMTTTSSPTTTEELGCCYGEGVKENEMCGNKIGREQCERSGKCEFREGADADCEFVPTTTTEQWTTSEPWLGAKDEAVLFAGENSSVVSEAMNTQISLSTIVLLAVVALTAQQLYKWWANSRSNDGYTKLAEGTQVHTTYQSA